MSEKRHPLTHSHQPTLLASSVSGLVILWLMSFAGEIYGDLDEAKRGHLFWAIAWLFPPFALNCINLALQFTFREFLQGPPRAIINVFAAVVTFVTFVFCALEIRQVLLPPNGPQNDVMDGMLIFLLSGWAVMILVAMILAYRRHRTTDEQG